MNYRINGLKCILVISLLAISNLVYAQSGTCYTIVNSAVRQTTPQGFVWKPISEGNGNLVVLFPSSSSSTGAAIYFGGNLIATGNYVGRTNGDRPTVRFGAPGGAYPSGLIVCDGASGGGTPPAPTPPPPPPPPPEPEPPEITPIINLLLLD